MTTDAPQPGTPLPWEANGPYIREAAPSKVVISHMLPYHRGDEEQNRDYLVYAANRLPELEADRARLLAMLTRVVSKDWSVVEGVTADARALLAEMEATDAE